MGTRRVVLTGGPGAGKTAVLDIVRRSVCAHIAVLPEAAGIVFGGGFPRDERLGSRRAAQRVIFFTELELENVAIDERIAVAWAGHPHRFTVAATESFASKATRTLEILRDHLPASCQAHFARTIERERVLVAPCQGR